MNPAETKASPPRKVYVAIAAHFAGSDILFVQSLAALLLRTTVPIQVGFSTDPSVERARNILTANFLESDCTHILFVDADIGFSAEDVARISSHGWAVVGGMYPLKNQNPVVQWCGNALPEGQPGNPEAMAAGLLPVKYIGTGFLCIARHVFERMIAVGSAPEYRQDFAPNRLEFAFWRQGVEDRRFLTEDWMFCHQWLKLGGAIFADRSVVLKHAGRAEWPLPLQTGNPFNPDPLEPSPANPAASPVPPVAVAQ